MTTYKVLKNEKILSSPETYSITFLSPEIASEATPGQIMEVKCGENFLRRPFGICESDAEKGTVRFCFEIRGTGTEYLSKLCPGDDIDVIAPLGNGFPEFENKRILLVGGGIGVFPLLSCKSFKNCTFDMQLAFRSADRICLEDEFKKFCDNVYISTDDGSKGFHGFAASFLKTIDLSRYAAVFAVGPVIMMKTVAEYVMTQNVPCYVSMEERMGCGVGACLGCACPVKNEKGELTYKRVCADGPVFNAEEIIWSELK